MGLGFYPLPDGSFRKIPQIGRVVIGDAVEIGANTCIDRAMMGDTVIEAGVKLDNLIQVGHNTVVGAHSVLAAQSGFVRQCTPWAAGAYGRASRHGRSSHGGRRRGDWRAGWSTY